MSYLLPEKGISEVYSSQSHKTYISKSGNLLSLKIKRTKIRRKNPLFILNGNNGFRVLIYVSKKIKGYGYGNLNGTNDLVVIKKEKSRLEITIYKNGWLYFDILFIEHINNK